jgi:hypothetical protein
MAVVKTADGSCAASHRATMGDGLGFSASESTLVSRTIILRISVAYARVRVVAI